MRGAVSGVVNACRSKFCVGSPVGAQLTSGVPKGLPHLRELSLCGFKHLIKRELSLLEGFPHLQASSIQANQPHTTNSPFTSGSACECP